jgi:hypothetical protein
MAFSNGVCNLPLFSSVIYELPVHMRTLSHTTLLQIQLYVFGQNKPLKNNTKPLLGIIQEMYN